VIKEFSWRGLRYVRGLDGDFYLQSESIVPVPSSVHHSFGGWIADDHGVHSAATELPRDALASWLECRHLELHDKKERLSGELAEISTEIRGHRRLVFKGKK